MFGPASLSPALTLLTGVSGRRSMVFRTNALSSSSAVVCLNPPESDIVVATTARHGPSSNHVTSRQRHMNVTHNLVQRHACISEISSFRSVPPQSLFVGVVIIVECQSYHPLVSSSSFVVVVVVVVVAVFIIRCDGPAPKNRRVWSLDQPSRQSVVSCHQRRSFVFGVMITCRNFCLGIFRENRATKRKNIITNHRIATSAVAIHDFGVFSSIIAQGYCQSNL